MWEEGLRVALRCMTEAPFTGHAGRVRDDAAAQRRPEAACRSRTRRCGSRAAAATRSTSPRRRGSARSRSRSSTPKRRGTGSTTTTRRSRREGVPIGDAVNPNVACVTTFMCHDDEDEALRRGLEGANFFGYSLAHYYVFGRHQPGRDRRVGRVPGSAAPSTATTPRRCEAARDERATGSAPRSSQEGIGGLRGAVGTPDQIREYLRRYEECGVDQVIFCIQAGKNRHEHIMESLELFGSEVLPEFVERDEKLAARQGAAARAGDRRGRWRASRRRTTRRCPTDDYAFPAIPRRWPTASATTTSTRCSTTSPSSPRSAPSGDRDADRQPRSACRRPAGTLIAMFEQLAELEAELEKLEARPAGDLRVRRPARRARRRPAARRAEAGRRRVPRVPRHRDRTSPTRARCSRGEADAEMREYLGSEIDEKEARARRARRAAPRAARAHATPTTART